MRDAAPFPHAGREERSPLARGYAWFTCQREGVRGVILFWVFAASLAIIGPPIVVLGIVVTRIALWLAGLS